MDECTCMNHRSDVCSAPRHDTYPNKQKSHASVRPHNAHLRMRSLALPDKHPFWKGKNLGKAGHGDWMWRRLRSRSARFSSRRRGAQEEMPCKPNASGMVGPGSAEVTAAAPWRRWKGEGEGRGRGGRANGTRARDRKGQSAKSGIGIALVPRRNPVLARAGAGATVFVLFFSLSFVPWLLLLFFSFFFFGKLWRWVLCRSDDYGGSMREANAVPGGGGWGLGMRSIRRGHVARKWRCVVAGG